MKRRQPKFPPMPREEQERLIAQAARDGIVRRVPNPAQLSIMPVAELEAGNLTQREIAYRLKIRNN